MPSSLNGTGVTFNDGSTLQSGNIPTANLGTGTADSTTFLRGDRTWQTISTTPTTAQVLSATAGASVGAVGTYAFLRSANFTSVAPGGTKAGSNLFYAGQGGNNTSGFGSPAGTWRCMGRDDSQSGSYASIQYATVWLRIS